MKQLFMVTRGQYSDYGVVAVFTSTKKAREHMDKFPDDYNNIEHITVDPDSVQMLNNGYRIFHVYMLKNGDTERVENLENIDNYHIGNINSANIWRRSKAPAFHGKGIPDCLDTYVWAKDAISAVKIVNEMRSKLIANGEWND